MASFQAKIEWERPRKRENKSNHSDQFLPGTEQKIPKNSKKIQKLVNTITASFQAKIDWERSRK